MSATAIWERLLQAGLVQGEAPEPAARSPWFVRVMLGVAGWLGALFLLFWVGIGLSFIIRNSGAALIFGIVACGVASVLYRKFPEGDFAQQFAFAVSLTGQALIVFGVVDSLGSKSMAMIGIAVAAVEALLFWLLPNYLHRIWAAGTGACAVALALGDMGLYSVAPALILVAFTWVWLREFDFGRRAALLRAGGYGLSIAAVVIAVMHGERSLAWLLDHPRMPVGGLIGIWIGAALTSAALLWAVVQLLAREDISLDSAQGKIAIIGAIVLAVATLKAPGIGPAAAVLVIGFANGNRILAGLGILALLAYLSHYYYSLQITLLEKSGVLAATGVALLAARFLLDQYWPAPKEGASNA